MTQDQSLRVILLLRNSTASWTLTSSGNGRSQIHPPNFGTLIREISIERASHRPIYTRQPIRAPSPSASAPSPQPASEPTPSSASTIDASSSTAPSPGASGDSTASSQL